MTRPLVIIDPGHGGGNRGAGWRFAKDPAAAVDPRKGIRGEWVRRWPGDDEATLNLEIAWRLTNALRVSGAARPSLNRTRDCDPSWDARADGSDEAVCAVSIHCNANASPDLSGLEVYVRPRNRSDLTLAASLERYIGGRIFEADPDKGEWLERPLCVIDRYACPVVLIECGYLSNDADRAQLNDPSYRAWLALVIAAGLAGYVTSR